MATTTYCTAATLKEWMRIDDAVEDSSLDLVIEAASREIDDYLGWRVYVDDSETARTYPVRYRDVVFLSDPISTTTNLVVKTDDAAVGTYGTTWTISTDFVLEPRNGIFGGASGFPFWVIRAVGARWFPVSREPTLQVTAKWGFASVPKPVELACVIQAAKLHARRNAREGVLGFEGAGVATAPKGLDGDVMRMLQPYMRPNPAAV